MPGETTPPGDGTTGTTDQVAAAVAAVSGTPPKTFTQEQLDAIIAERLKRAVPADYEELKTLAAKAKAMDEKEKSELQKAQEKAAKAEQDGQSAIAQAQGMLRRAGILTEAATQGAADAEMVATLLTSSEGITVSADGVVSGAKEAVKKLLTDKPFLKKGQTAGASGGQFPGTDAKTLDERIAEAESKKDWSTARQLKVAKANLAGTTS